MSHLPPEASEADCLCSRAQWPGQKLRLADLDGQEPDLSATTTMQERLAMMWQLAQDAWAFRGEAIIEPELSRHIVRVVRRGR